MGIHSNGGFPSKNPRGPEIKEITFTAGGTGLAAAETDLFTVIGAVLVHSITAYCTTSLEQSLGTPELALGVNSGIDDFIASTVATLIDAGELWIDGTPTTDSIALPAGLKDILVEENISCTVGGTNNISAGVISFAVLWTPITVNGTVVAT